MSSFRTHTTKVGRAVAAVQSARFIIVASILTTSAVGPVGCKRAETGDQKTKQVRQDRYTVQGIVAELPIEGSPTTEFKVRHVAMPHFVGQDGKLGMDTMTMGFPVKQGLTLEGLKVGDKIELAFEVDFDTVTGQLLDYRATGFSVLPPETQLDFTPLAAP